MKRPILLRILPEFVAESLFYRFYNKRSAQYAGLFEKSELKYAAGACMHDLIVGDVISGNIALAGFFELDLTRRLSALADKGGTFVDVGANMGYFSLIWAGRKATNRVIAFEASPRNIVLLKNNFERNKLDDRVRLIARAAGREAGVLQFDIGPVDQTGWGGITPESSETTIDVEVVRLDEQLAGVTIDVLKIDVEGADTWVLQGCEGLLREKKIREIYYEQNPGRMDFLGIGADEAVRFLEKMGYKSREIADGLMHAVVKD